ncbi:MAG: hypothetical protein HY815_28495 [Candidatus Riflebacteria bacterium]|nr:hypothetical protein [Candidatus Riflebacteria bacterium]
MSGDDAGDNVPTLASAKAEVNPLGDCPVCGCQLGDDTVQCHTCTTSHHKDCWAYNGGCATFACPARGEQAGRAPKAVPDDCCPVCGDALKGPTVRCRSCRHPHHQPCWVQNRGCGTMGCMYNPGAAAAAAAASEPAALPEKILLPKLRVGVFSGVQFVPWPTVVFTIAMELLAIGLAPVVPALASLCLAGLISGLIWAAITAERYNINLAWKAITKSKEVLGLEVFEWISVPFDSVKSLELYHEPYSRTAYMGVTRSLVPWALQLTQSMPVDGPEYKEMQKILRQMHAFSIVPVPMLEMAGLPRRLPPGRRS